MVAVDFIFEGVELGGVKKNAPIVIAKAMAAVSGILMILVSMIMGVPVLRDYQYNTEALLFTNQVTKRDYLLGRFLGSLTVLVLIFSALPTGMMLGLLMPWQAGQDLLAFNALHYLQAFGTVVLPSLLFGACLFFVSGMLSKKLLVVYTQGVFIFVLFLLSRAISNEFLQGLLDPFSLTTLTQLTEDWSINERNNRGILPSGILLYNKLFWLGLGILILIFGYRRFSLSQLVRKGKKTIESKEESQQDILLPKVSIRDDFQARWSQLYQLSVFYTRSLVKEHSFWAIIICGIIIILINSVNMGTSFGVDSYPATYFIIEEGVNPGNCSLVLHRL